MTGQAELRARLDRLGNRAPSTASAGTAGLGELAARIARLRGRADGRAPAAPQALAAALGGREVAPGVVLVERSYPLWQRIGRLPLGGLRSAVGEGLPADRASCLFVDTETTGLAGGTGTVAWMIGVGRLGAGDFRVRQWVIAGFAGEAEMLRAVAAELRADDVLVSFNGKCYDLPLLAVRHRLHGLDDPWEGRPHLDLRYPLKRRHGAGLPDGRLKTMEEALLGHRRSHDLPGAEAPRAWLSWLRGGRPGRVPDVAAHNRADLLAMAGLCQCLAGPPGPVGERGRRPPPEGSADGPPPVPIVVK